MGSFVPKQRSEIKGELDSDVLATAPISSSKLGKVVDTLHGAVADQMFSMYFQASQALALLSLDTTTGQDLDAIVSEFPGMPSRQQPTNATGTETLTDPGITKIATTIATGGGNTGNNFLNVANAAALPSAGSVLVGVRGSPVFETFTYTSKVGNQLQSTSDTLDFDHGSGEPVVKTTVGDRSYAGPFTLTTQATSTSPSKTYVTTSPFVIFDGEASGVADIRANAAGPAGNTPAGTIAEFVGTKPFAQAVCTNAADITNGLPLESDADLRQRIRRQRQALSSASIDPVTATLFATTFNGQRVKFAQLVEDPDPALPSLFYLDDGSGFVPTQASISTPIILKASASGGETHFRIDMAFMPIVTTLVENGTRVFANITVKKNGVTMTQGDGPTQYRVQPNNGNLRVNTALAAGDSLEVFALTYFTGLLALANKNLYGDRSDRANFPGIVGLGQWVQPRSSSVQSVDLVGAIVLDGSRPLADVVADIKQAIQSYLNSLGIGVTVIKNRVQSLAFVAGVQDFTLSSLAGLSPAADVVIADGVLAKAGVLNIT